MARPIEYKESYPQKTDDYVNSHDIPFIEELALDVLNCDDETIREWAKKFPEFSVSIKRLMIKQKLALQKASLGKKFNVSGAIFQLKANHGMIETEKRIQEHSGGIDISVNYEQNPAEPNNPEVS